MGLKLSYIFKKSVHISITTETYIVFEELTISTLKI